MTKPIILHLCADTGSDSYPYKMAGYDVRLIGSQIGVENYHPPKDVYGVFANPVCTFYSKAREANKTQGDETKGHFLVDECLRIIDECNPEFYVIENPATGTLKNYLGKPQFVYEPWHFGSPWTKKTALWGRFEPPMPIFDDWDKVPKNDKLYIRPNRKKPGFAFLHKAAIADIDEFAPFSVDSDMEFRSLCSQKFAQAFFDANNCGFFNYSV